MKSLRYSNSKLKIAPPNGNLKMPPIAEPIPAVIAIRISSSLSLKTLPIIDASVDPVCASESSIPPLVPLPTARILERVLRDEPWFEDIQCVIGSQLCYVFRIRLNISHYIAKKKR